MKYQKRKPRLLIVGAFPGKNSKIYGGIVTTCQLLLNSELSNQFELLLIDSTQIRNPPPIFLIRLYLAIKRFYRYLKMLFSSSPDAVLLFTSTGASAFEKGIMARFARSRGIPALLFPRGEVLINSNKDTLLMKILMKFAMSGGTHLLCQGAAWQKFAINTVGFKKENSPIIYNWSATSKLLKIGTERDFSLANSRINIVFIGWLEKEKGVFELLDACKKLAIQHKFILSIAGRGSSEKAARTFVYDNDLEDYVRFIGWIQGNQKDDLLKTADILVLPSWYEGFPNVVIEAMSAKVAVIVSAVGNVQSILDDRVHALLIPPKSVEAIMTALSELISRPNFRIKIGTNGYEFAKKNFSTELGILNLISIINNAIGNLQHSKNSHV
ncbi:glycosyltransferase family 4 protein [Polynucleobacter sp. MWH-UH24A]|uniref:glycosyltransferase family 4 protein n=1 Tax=Polynucleobacter sp. MWH-UH24A TaxID=2689110 RepID=UPI001BFD36BA|nr:glycosyltransferase family 4 protein [Polynucleobacter sp. MWH-UH24A]QWD76434.1 glycosyltransferase family 4 protein [Polynucleobacter sp. MWH-UH24A]